MIIVNEMLDYSVRPEKGHNYIFTGNASVRKDGALVMGRGAARQVRDLYPEIQYTLGAAINNSDNTLPYDMLVTIDAGFPIWVFQVKYHFKDSADLFLIARSCLKLAKIAYSNPKETYHMNFPGIGNGKLAEQEDVILGFLRHLPDNVIVYREKL